MRTDDVKIGGEYLTRVSGDLVRVRVVRETLVGRPPRRRRAFVVRRVETDLDTGNTLPKPRTAAALRPVDGAL